MCSPCSCATLGFFLYRKHNSLFIRKYNATRTQSCVWSAPNCGPVPIRRAESKQNSIALRPTCQPKLAPATPPTPPGPESGLWVDSRTEPGARTTGVSSHPTTWSREREPCHTADYSRFASRSSTLRTLSAIVCGRSVRVPSLMVVEMRGAPISWMTSWQRLTAPGTRSQSPPTVVP